MKLAAISLALLLSCAAIAAEEELRVVIVPEAIMMQIAARFAEQRELIDTLTRELKEAREKSGCV